MHDETRTDLDRWVQLRRHEEWLLAEILKSRGVHRSAFKRILVDIQNVIDELEEQLFGKI